MEGAAMDRREALTVRVSVNLLARARATRAERESLNDVIVQALDREARRREGLRAVQDLVAARERITTASGPQPDSTALIRELREGRQRDGWRHPLPR